MMTCLLADTESKPTDRFAEEHFGTETVEKYLPLRSPYRYRTLVDRSS